MNWLERVRREIGGTEDRPTANTAEGKSNGTIGSTVSGLCAHSDPSIGSNRSTVTRRSPEFDASREVQQFPPLSSVQEAARQEVLGRLEAHPSVKRAFTTRFEGDVLIVTLAIRGVGTGELAIPADRFNRDTLADFETLATCLDGPGGLA